jgi:hypothetical protein
MGSEDFARLLAHVPGNVAFVGNGPTATLHNPDYDFADAALPHIVAYFRALVRDRLPRADALTRNVFPPPLVGGAGGGGNPGDAASFMQGESAGPEDGART